VDVTPHFVTAGDGAGGSALRYALVEVAHGRTERLALFHLGDLGLPLTWRVGLPGLALGLVGAGLWGTVRGRPQPAPG